ncbi:hypothetical protein F7725_019045 [Dissostichus mawsoni]|uniref:Uncharacterized protein n=1 Tax=Dissostichus mawsoni TaxID=36200 RepID=A0A7J5XW23_DISMA|nr:hypothetical protein F7725_019045 [Dissostichus mawsoni]
MGAKQSSPTANPAANGRTRAYSGSDLPSSTSSSNGNRTTTGGVRYHGYSASGASSSTSQHHGARARSAGGSGGPGTRPQSGINIPNSSGAYSSQESGGSSPEEADRQRAGGQEAPRLLIGSLPAHLSPHLFGANAAQHVMAGKGYAHAIRTHKLTLQALWRLLLPRLCTYLDEVDVTLRAELSDLCQSSRMERDDGDESKICVSLKEHCVFQEGGDTL